MKLIEASLTLQVGSFESFSTSGMIKSSVASSPIAIASFDRFSSKETLTSVQDSFVKICTTAGNICSTTSYLGIASAKSQIAEAKEPLTC